VLGKIHQWIIQIIYLALMFFMKMEEQQLPLGDLYIVAGTVVNVLTKEMVVGISRKVSM
jgi:hypothetical protein